MFICSTVCLSWKTPNANTLVRHLREKWDKLFIFIHTESETEIENVFRNV